MVLVTASKLNLPQSPSSPPQILSANYEPNSRSLALTHSDSSLSLYSAISPISQTLAAHQTLTVIPSPISSSAFVLLQSNSVTDLGTVEDPRVIFVVASPLKAGAAVCFRFYALKSGQVFSKVKVICKQKDCVFDDKSGGVVVSVTHGIAVRLSGSVNVFTMYSVSNSRIWVFALKMVSDDEGGGGDGGVVKLMKCAVIECKVPVWSICVSYGYLILGEDNGIRVFALRPLVKGHGSKSVMYDNKHKGKPVKGKHMGHVFKMPNRAASNGSGIVEGGYSKLDDGHEVGAKFNANGMTVESHCSVHLEQKSNTHACVKLRSIRVGHESGMFKSFSILNSESLKSTSTQITTAKAISIKAMSANKFLILDSLGNLHLLSLSKLVGSKLNLQMRQLAQFMKVQKFDVFPGTQTIWLSDGFYTVQMIILGDVDPANNESSDHINEGNPTVTGNQVIFTSEKIQDVVSLPANAVLIFGQGVWPSEKFPSWGCFVDWCNLNQDETQLVVVSCLWWPLCKSMICEQSYAPQAQFLSFFPYALLHPHQVLRGMQHKWVNHLHLESRMFYAQWTFKLLQRLGDGMLGEPAWTLVGRCTSSTLGKLEKAHIWL